MTDKCDAAPTTAKASIQGIVSMDEVSTAPSAVSPKSVTRPREVKHPSSEDALVLVDTEEPRNERKLRKASNGSLAMCALTV